ncbi:GDSL esterase/lipase At1g74460-like [Chenopodium quinoa]|uniref:GDSL esterase/lipase n=1 Tax=Chenopodium quinoa TaxID=63459 RepID=A0A803L985_CHEQI|nr:GDSL esterase/lipase At1g74460-like [Chenopodium quinoa]
MLSMKFVVTLTLVIVTILGCVIDGYNCRIVQFIFGDSLSDVGNNEQLPKSLAKANLPWYGIDFGNGLPNGRFTNGRTVSDIIGDDMGLPRPPAFLDPNLDEDTILNNGVNYASGGGGILNETGGYFIQRLCMYKQIELFQGTQELIARKIGKNESRKFFEEARYVVALGSNDFINNYLMPVYSDSWKYNDNSFMDYLVGTLRDQLKILHGLGARKLMVFGLGPMGCIPLQRVLSTSGECQDKTNKLAKQFNEATDKMMQELSTSLTDATYKFGDAFDVVDDVIKNPNRYGFTNSDSPCCSFGRIRPALTCVPASILCKDRSKYVFWDEYHPSDSANMIIAKELIKKFKFTRVNQDDNGDGSPSPAPALGPAADAPSGVADAPSAADGPSGADAPSASS